MDLTNIKNLIISNAYIASMDLFFEFIPNFPNIEYLNLDRMHQDNPLEYLKRLEYFTPDSNVGEKTAAIFADQLESLMIDCRDYYGMFENAVFTNLKELSIAGEDSNFIAGNGFENMPNLKAVEFHLLAESYDDQYLDKIIRSNLSLERFHVRFYPDTCEFVMKDLEKYIFRYKDMKRKSDRFWMKVTLHEASLEWAQTEQLKDKIAFDCMKLIFFLSNIYKTVRFECVIYWNELQDELNGISNEIISELKRMTKNYELNYDLVGKTKFYFCVSDKEFAKHIDKMYQPFFL